MNPSISAQMTKTNVRLSKTYGSNFLKTTSSRTKNIPDEKYANFLLLHACCKNYTQFWQNICPLTHNLPWHKTVSSSHGRWIKFKYWWDIMAIRHLNQMKNWRVIAQFVPCRVTSWVLINLDMQIWKTKIKQVEEKWLENESRKNQREKKINREWQYKTKQ